MDRRVDKMMAALIDAILFEKARLGIKLTADSLCRAGVSASVADRVAKGIAVRRRESECGNRPVA